MEIRFVAHGSREWKEARELRYSSFFQLGGLPRSVLDDGEEANGKHLVALIADRVIGYGRLFDSGNGEFHLSQLVVSPEHQRQGIGRMLLDSLINRARSDGGTTVRLNGRLSAVAFYASAGFHSEGDVFQSQKTGLPHVKMTLDISARRMA